MRAARAQSHNLMMHSSMALSLAQEQHVGVRCLLDISSMNMKAEFLPARIALRSLPTRDIKISNYSGMLES